MGTLGIAKNLPTLKRCIKLLAGFTAQEADTDVLEKYAKTGETPPELYRYLPSDWAKWESWMINHPLKMYCGRIWGGVWADLGAKGTFEHAAMTKAYALESLLLWKELDLEMRGPARFSRLEFGKLMPFLAHEYLARGFALGCRDLATRQAKMLIEAYRRNMFTSIECYPLDYMILRVLCDWLDQPQANWHSVAYESPIMNALVEHWRTTDLGRLAIVLDDACDYHTHRYKVGTNGGTDFREFGFVDYARYPVEILMILRLRSYLGLENPELDHPLMKDPPGHLPPAQPLVMDELTTAVYQRMKSQGFDEEKIYRMFVPTGD